MTFDPLKFGDNRDANVAEMARFEAAAQLVKSPAHDDDYRLRLSCYLGRHKEQVLAALKKRYPKTWEEMQPYVLPVTRYFVDERAKVFLDGADLKLVGADGEDLADDAPEHETWERIDDDAALALRLKRVDAYTTLDSTAFLVWGHSPAGPIARVALPDIVAIVPDVDDPFDLDKAWLRVELGSDAVVGVDTDGKPIATTLKRYAFWSALDGGMYEVLRADGERQTDKTLQGKNPYIDDDGVPVAPIVMFTQHTEELGLFARQDEWLREFDVAFCVGLSDLALICAAEGFGQLVIQTSLGGTPPSSSQIVRGPSHAIVLPEGTTGELLTGGATIAAHVSKLQTDLKTAALLYGIPPGAVSLEARAVSSGIALTIEMRPLLERRSDTVKMYAQPMRRLFRVAKAVWNRYAAENGEDAIGDGVTARWEPGEVQTPTDPQAELDQIVLQVSRGWMSDEEAVAKIRGVTEADAKALLDKIRSDKAAKAAAAPAPPQPPVQDITAGARQTLMAPGAQRQAMQQAVEGAPAKE